MLFEPSLISLALVKNVLMVSSVSSLSFSFMLPLFSLFRELINGLIVLQKLVWSLSIFLLKQFIEMFSYSPLNCALYDSPELLYLLNFFSSLCFNFFFPKQAMGRNLGCLHKRKEGPEYCLQRPQLAP